MAAKNEDLTMGGASRDPFVAQADAAYGQAVKDFHKNPNDPALGIALGKAAVERVNARIKAGLIDAKSEAGKALAKSATTLQTTLLQAQQELAKTAGDKTLTLAEAVNSSQREALVKETNTLFDLAIAGKNPSINFLAGVRGIAEVLGVLGVDVSNFLRRVDDRLEEILSSLPKINTKRIGGAPTNVSPSGAVATLVQTTGAAITQIPNATAAINSQLLSISGALAPSSATPPARRSKVQLEDAIHVLTDPKDPIKGLTAKEAEALLRSVAGRDGDSNTLSQTEVSALRSKMLTGGKKPSIVQSVGGRLDLLFN